MLGWVTCLLAIADVCASLTQGMQQAGGGHFNAKTGSGARTSKACRNTSQDRVHGSCQYLVKPGACHERRDALRTMRAL